MAPTSNSQARVLKLLSLTVADEYAAAASTLETAGYRPDGIPHGGTWRTAKKMSDADLLAAVKIDYEARYVEPVDRY